MARPEKFSAAATERNIRNQLTLIALCADSLELELAPLLSAEQQRQFALVQASIVEIKAVLDQLSIRFRREKLLLEVQLGGRQLIGLPPDHGTPFEIKSEEPG